LFNVNIHWIYTHEAVVRNRAKRQLREVVRLLLKQGVLAEGYYVLAIAKPGILAKEYAEISQEMTLLLKKSGVLR
jgi:ribonuclease P protein component